MNSPIKFGQRVCHTQNQIINEKTATHNVRQRLFDYETQPVKQPLFAFSRPHFIWSAGLSSAVAAVAIAAFLLWPASPLDFRVGTTQTTVAVGASPSTGQWIGSSENNTTPVRFSDGTKVILQPSAGIRVTQTDANGATVLLEQGDVHFNVIHREETSWQVDAGPFTVKVTGTIFDINWNPQTGFFAIDLKEGSVNVTGPTLEGQKIVVAGQSMHAWVKTKQAKVMATRELQNSGSIVAIHTPTGEPIAGSMEAEQLLRQPGTDTPGSHSTAIALSKGGIGKASGVNQLTGNHLVAQVVAPKNSEQLVETKTAKTKTDELKISPLLEHKGRIQSEATTRFNTKKQAGSASAKTRSSKERSLRAQASKEDLVSDAVKETGSPKNNLKKDTAEQTEDNDEQVDQSTAQALLHQANVDRLHGNIAGATQTYRRLRSSFPNSTEATLAAFYLGRLAFDLKQNYGESSRWLETYLREQRGEGPVREALGRLLETYEKLDKKVLMKKTATNYIKNYPYGPHAPLAKRILKND